MANVEKTLELFFLNSESKEKLLNGKYGEVLKENQDFSKFYKKSFLAVFIWTFLFSVFGLFGKIFFLLVFCGGIGFFCASVSLEKIKAVFAEPPFHFYVSSLLLLAAGLLLRPIVFSDFLQALLACLFVACSFFWVFKQKKEGETFFRLLKPASVSFSVLFVLLLLQSFMVETSYANEQAVRDAMARKERTNEEDTRRVTDELNRNKDKELASKSCYSEEECATAKEKQNKVLKENLPKAEENCTYGIERNVPAARYRWTEETRFVDVAFNPATDLISLSGRAIQVKDKTGNWNSAPYQCFYNIRNQRVQINVKY